MSNHKPPSNDDGSTATTYVRDRDEAPARSVVEAVSTATSTDLTDLDPLYETIDPDALNDLVQSNVERDRPSPSVCIRFTYSGCLVTVYADGRTVVGPSDDGSVPLDQQTG